VLADTSSACECYLLRETDPQGWAQYLAEAEELAGVETPITEEWAGGRG
jgi:hypothetical protein